MSRQTKVVGSSAVSGCNILEHVQRQSSNATSVSIATDTCKNDLDDSIASVMEPHQCDGVSKDLDVYTYWKLEH